VIFLGFGPAELPYVRSDRLDYRFYFTRDSPWAQRNFAGAKQLKKPEPPAESLLRWNRRCIGKTWV